MSFKNITYYRRNQLLYIILIILLIIAWLFSFSKTWKLYKENILLANNINQLGPNFQDLRLENEKYSRLDSLISLYKLDSNSYSIDFLSNVTYAINNLPVQLVYDSSKSENNSTLTTHTISLIGDYKVIIQAIHRLEKMYFISRVEYVNGYYLIESRSLVSKE